MLKWLNQFKDLLSLYSVLLMIVSSPLSIQATTSPAPIYTIQIKGAIGPAYADFFEKSLNTAIENNAQAFILQLDTPGGLDSSMRDIIQAILA